MAGARSSCKACRRGLSGRLSRIFQSLSTSGQGHGVDAAPYQVQCKVADDGVDVCSNTSNERNGHHGQDRAGTHLQHTETISQRVEDLYSIICSSRPATDEAFTGLSFGVLPTRQEAPRTAREIVQPHYDDQTPMWTADKSLRRNSESHKA